MFRESGYDGVGLDAIMHEAGLTAGGFYAHFASKEVLFAEAMATALEPRNTLRAAKTSVPNGADPLGVLIKGYLSRTHRDSVAEGCPQSAKIRQHLHGERVGLSESDATRLSLVPNDRECSKVGE